MIELQKPSQICKDCHIPGVGAIVEGRILLPSEALLMLTFGSFSVQKRRLGTVRSV
jgi:hypothetical protein